MKSGTIKIFIGNRPVGAIQSLEVDHCCPIAITSSREIVEKGVYPKITASRVRFDKLQIAEAFSRGFVNAKTQMYPLQIQAEDDKEICEIRNAWITGQDYSYTTSDWIITDAVEFEAEKIVEIKKK